MSQATSDRRGSMSSSAPSGEPVIVGDKKIYKIRGATFEVDAKYELVKAIGFGAYGLVCSAKDCSTEPPTPCAIKKIPKVFDDLIDGKRVLREVKLLQYLKHENVLTLMDIMRPREGVSQFRDLYVVTQLMETDLHHVIKSRQRLTQEHHQYFLYQLMLALRYVHSAGVIHRDLKPGNMLVNGNCDMKLCDFGLARGGMSPAIGPQELTDYVITRWYRPPELLLMCHYTHAVDMWSAGCILGELINRKPLFPGKDYINQLTLITDVVSPPAEADQGFINSAEGKKFLNSMPAKQVKHLGEIMPSASPEALDLIQKLMAFNPANRITAEQALRHPYFSHLFEPQDDVTMPRDKVDDRQWEFDHRDLKERDLRDLFWAEVVKFHPDDEKTPKTSSLAPRKASSPGLKPATSPPKA